MRIKLTIPQTSKGVTMFTATFPAGTLSFDEHLPSMSRMNQAKLVRGAFHKSPERSTRCCWHCSRKIRPGKKRLNSYKKAANWRSLFIAPKFL